MSGEADMPNEGTVVAKERPTVEGLSDPVWIRIRDMRYGYYESRQIDFANEPGWLYLVLHFPNLAGLDFARFTFMLDEYAKEVGELVSTVFAPA
jgi:hypothetical protein